MNSYLDELYAHQEWADAEHWRAIEAHPAALADKAIRERLLHIHLVQHGFLWVTAPQRTEFIFKKLEDFPSIANLKMYARQGLEEMRERLWNTDQVRMEEVIEVPWFNAGVGRRSAHDGLHCVVARRTTGGSVVNRLLRFAVNHVKRGKFHVGRYVYFDFSS